MFLFQVAAVTEGHSASQGQGKRGLPELTVQNVEQWANMDGNIPRAVLLKGYSNWVEGYIHDVEGKANV